MVFNLHLRKTFSSTGRNLSKSGVTRHIYQIHSNCISQIKFDRLKPLFCCYTLIATHITALFYMNHYLIITHSLQWSLGTFNRSHGRVGDNYTPLLEPLFQMIDSDYVHVIPFPFLTTAQLSYIRCYTRQYA